MDDAIGEKHPEWAANLVLKRLGPESFYLCLLHSRHYARNCNVEPSTLCWADKYSIMYEPWWFYLPRAWLSGELMEYRLEVDAFGSIPLSATHREWFRWVRGRLSMLGKEKRGDCTPYMQPKRTETISSVGD
jgi:hypothetical protein